VYLDAKDLPPAVSSARHRRQADGLAERESAENVLWYRKIIRIHAGEIFSRHLRVSAITDILRVTVKDWLYAMDNPRVEIPVFDERDSRTRTIEASKVYHVNVVLHMAGGAKGFHDTYQRLRLVLDRQGIKRIENVPL
jgi:hypothetical protein